jgi:hypothetical protein
MRAFVPVINSTWARTCPIIISKRATCPNPMSTNCRILMHFWLLHRLTTTYHYWILKPCCHSNCLAYYHSSVTTCHWYHQTICLASQSVMTCHRYSSVTTCHCLSNLTITSLCPSYCMAVHHQQYPATCWNYHWYLATCYDVHLWNLSGLFGDLSDLYHASGLEPCIFSPSQVVRDLVESDEGLISLHSCPTTWRTLTLILMVLTYVRSWTYQCRTRWNVLSILTSHYKIQDTLVQLSCGIFECRCNWECS